MEFSLSFEYVWIKCDDDDNDSRASDNKDLWDAREVDEAMKRIVREDDTESSHAAAAAASSTPAAQPISLASEMQRNTASSSSSSM